MHGALTSNLVMRMWNTRMLERKSLSDIPNSFLCCRQITPVCFNENIENEKVHLILLLFILFYEGPVLLLSHKTVQI